MSAMMAVFLLVSNWKTHKKIVNIVVIFDGLHHLVPKRYSIMAYDENLRSFLKIEGKSDSS